MTELDPSTDDLARALRAPGTATELADEERYLAMFRETVDAPPAEVRTLPRRIGRLGVGGTAVVVTVALTSGVAAAYTGHLPDPVQRLAHTVIGAPAPDPDPVHRHSRTTSQPGATLIPQPSPSAGSTAPPTPSAGATPGGSPTSTPGLLGGGTYPTPTSDPAGTSGPSARRPRARARRAPPAPSRRAGRCPVRRTASPWATGSLSPGCSPTPTVRRSPTTRPRSRCGARGDGAPWARPPRTRPGNATFTGAPPLPRSAVFRWRTDHRVHSAPWWVRLVPTLAATAEVDAGATVSVTTAGARGGDRVELSKRTPLGLVAVRRGRLDATGAITFVVTPRHRTAYVVRLLPTSRHAAARARVVVGASRGRRADGARPDPSGRGRRHHRGQRGRLGSRRQRPAEPPRGAPAAYADPLARGRARALRRRRLRLADDPADRGDRALPPADRPPGAQPGLAGGGGARGVGVGGPERVFGDRRRCRAGWAARRRGRPAPRARRRRHREGRPHHAGGEKTGARSSRCPRAAPGRRTSCGCRPPGGTGSRARGPSSRKPPEQAAEPPPSGDRQDVVVGRGRQVVEPRPDPQR